MLSGEGQPPQDQVDDLEAEEPQVDGQSVGQRGTRRPRQEDERRQI